ncbi:MAG: pyruvate kinase [Candidatus Margulisiibacteriota bacterium]|jgi:pyruvate kinase
MRKTKIVATLGPACNNYETIKKLIEKGLNVARLNFSHATHQEHKMNVDLLRKASAELDKPVAILQDLQGPKIRTGKLKNSKPVTLVNDQKFVITIRNIVGDNNEVCTVYKGLPKDAEVGKHIFLSDGLINLEVLEITDQDVICKVLNGGVLREHQGINLPGSHISSPAVTEKDIQDLKFGLKLNVDYVAISFVRTAQDIIDVKKLIKDLGHDTPVIAKLERQEAIEDLDQILDVADAVMIARGDLGVELPPEQVPLLQKKIIKAANKKSVPVITATQMLESMIEHPRPTRAETSDVANAILDGSDAVMLSGETASGLYPVESIEMMSKIAEYVEENFNHLCAKNKATDKLPNTENISEGIGAAVSTIENTMPISAIWVHTMSGSTAKLISHFRPTVPIYAFTPNEKILRRLSLFWGVMPFKVKFYKNYQGLEETVYPLLKKYKLAKKGDIVVVTGGYPIKNCGPTNFLKIEVIKDHIDD